MILHETGSPPGKSLKLSQLCEPGSAICDAGWPTPDCPWSMSVCRSHKKYFRNFNFNFNYRELLSKSATFSLRRSGVVSGFCRDPDCSDPLTSPSIPASQLAPLSFAPLVNSLSLLVQKIPACPPSAHLLNCPLCVVDDDAKLLRC